MRILITGTTGWLGAALASNLAAKDSHEVVGLARRTTLLDGVASLQADLSSKQDMEALSKQPAFDVVVHLAGSGLVLSRAGCGHQCGRNAKSVGRHAESWSEKVCHRLLGGRHGQLFASFPTVQAAHLQ